MISSRPLITRSNVRWPRRFWTASSSSDTSPGDHAADQQRQIEQQVQRDRAADDLGEIGCHGDQFGLQPVGDPGRGAGVVGDGFGQRASGDQAELGRQVLHEAGHGVGHDDDPHQQEAELRAGADVGRDIAGIDVGDGGDERRPEQEPARPQPRLGVLDQLTHLLSGHANRKVRLAETSERSLDRGYQPKPQPPKPMTMPPPQYGQPPTSCSAGGEVTIWALPLVWHCVVFGPVFVHSGLRQRRPARPRWQRQTPAAAKSGVRVTNLGSHGWPP